MVLIAVVEWERGCLKFGEDKTDQR
jgi:hypothetical protein